jgi:NAD(P)-dependent dehydrogenase (short-subunit alcohol dehydrogenase family)
VVIFGRNQETLDKAISEISNGTQAVQGDVRNTQDLDKLFQLVKDKYGKIDTLVVSAGGAKMAPIEDVTEELFDEINDINYKGAYFTVQKALPLMSAGSSVTLISSVANIKGFAGMSVYSALKAAVRSLARTFAAELAPHGIRVNSLSPGPIDTPSLTVSGCLKNRSMMPNRILPARSQCSAWPNQKKWPVLPFSWLLKILPMSTGQTLPPTVVWHRYNELKYRSQVYSETILDYLLFL